MWTVLRNELSISASKQNMSKCWNTLGWRGYAWEFGGKWPCLPGRAAMWRLGCDSCAVSGFAVEPEYCSVDTVIGINREISTFVTNSPETIEVQAARGLQDSLARAAVQDPTRDRKQETSLLPEWNPCLVWVPHRHVPLLFSVLLR